MVQFELQLELFWLFLGFFRPFSIFEILDAARATDLRFSILV